MNEHDLPGDPDRTPVVGAGRLAADLAGTVAVVTGGTRGVGRAVAQRLLDAGAEVLVCARTQPAATAAADRRRATFVAADVRDPEQARVVVDTCVQRYGRLDIWVNNAGGSPPAPAADCSPRFFERVVALNLLAPFFCAQAAFPVMDRQPTGGSIVNIGSISGSRPSPGTAAYGAAKAGLANLTRTLAMEWAPRVRVNAVVPGPVVTDDGLDHYGGADGLARVARTVPIGRMVTPDDVASACLYLVSPWAAAVTGALLRVDGGGERPPFLEAATPPASERDTGDGER
jgi:NAD(P)-dependent dehydrogenase (short-subunit alcohol dehydrogenase family)